jgi:hypothetical protein
LLDTLGVKEGKEDGLLEGEDEWRMVGLIEGLGEGKSS